MTGQELVAFARSKIGTPYVYGAKGEEMTEDLFDRLRKLYPQYVPLSDRKKVGEVCVDCSGLISWACNRPLNSSGWKAAAEKDVYPIATLGKAPVGALVWRKGHIGIYSGKKDGLCHYIAADGSKYGVREVPISSNDFTHWILVKDVFDYEEEEMVEKDTIIVDGKQIQVNMIRKDGVTYLKTRDIANALGLKVSSKGKIPVLETK